MGNKEDMKFFKKRGITYDNPDEYLWYPTAYDTSKYIMKLEEENERLRRVNGNLVKRMYGGKCYE